MKKVLFAISVAAMAILASCTKEAMNDNATSQEGFKVCILGDMGEFDATTKSTGESCIRLKWDGGETVYAFGRHDEGSNTIGYLGELTVALDDDNAYVAKMSGTLDKAPVGGKMYLLHSPLLKNKPSLTQVTGGAQVSVSLAEQPADCNIPFVAYATVENVTAATAQSNLKATFKFATTAIKANVYGLGGSKAIKYARVTEVENQCSITFGETITIGSGYVDENNAAGRAIVKALDQSSSATGKADFYIAVPKMTANTARTLTVCAEGNMWSKVGFVKPAVAENKYINTICDLSEEYFLPYEFYASDDKNVQFSKSNLYWDGSEYHFEEIPTDHPTSWDANHVGHFYWSSKASVAYAKEYKDDSRSEADEFFFGEGNEISVDGQSGLYALSKDEWVCLLADDWYKIVTVTNGSETYYNYLIIRPNGAAEISKDTYTLDELNAYGYACLPAAGWREADTVDDYSTPSDWYWSATSYDDKAAAFSICYDDENGFSADNGSDRAYGYCIRPVKTF